jgi:hypothetical protein
MSQALRVSHVLRYPIKGCAAVSVRACELDDYGLAADRRWLFLDNTGHFHSQRATPKMALIRPRSRGDELWLEAAGVGALAVQRSEGKRVEVEIWGGKAIGIDQGEAAADWFEAYIDRPGRLLRLADDGARAVEPEHAAKETFTGFADGYPLLIVSDASVEDLDSRLDEGVSLLNFRPNIVIAGCSPHDEDSWRTLRIGELVIDLVKPCARCAVVDVEPATGERRGDVLSKLATYRRHGGKVWFGVNAIHRGQGRVQVGDKVEVLQQSEPWFAMESTE